MASDRQPEDMMFLLGEMTGQLRELVHTVNNTATKIDAIGSRVSKLETAESKREGASTVWSALMKSPAVGWLVGAAVTAWAVLTGRVHL